MDYSEAVSNFGILNNFNKKERIASPSPPPKKQKSKKKERKDKKKRKHYSPKSSSPVIHMTKTQHNDVSDMEASDGEPSLPSKYANANQTHSVPSQPQMTITMSKPIGPTKPDSQVFYFIALNILILKILFVDLVLESLKINRDIHFLQPITKIF